jgi:hypothetical protein
MRAQRHAKACVIDLAVSRVLVVESIRAWLVSMGGISVATTISAIVCRWRVRWLPVGLPKARAKSLKLRHHQPVRVVACGRSMVVSMSSTVSERVLATELSRGVGAT